MSVGPNSYAACKKLRSFAPSQWRKWLRLAPVEMTLLDETTDSLALLSLLMAENLLPAAARLLGYGLPEREAVWWSCMCVRHTLPQNADAELAAVQAAEAWVRQPDNRGRHEAAQRAAVAGRDAPGAWSALGAAWSHRLHGLPDICGGRGAVEAAERAAVRSRPDRASLRLRRFIDAGIDVGNGGAGRLTVEDNECRLP